MTLCMQQAEQQRLQHKMRGVFGDDDHDAYTCTHDDAPDGFGVAGWLLNREPASVTPPKLSTSQPKEKSRQTLNPAPAPAPASRREVPLRSRSSRSSSPQTKEGIRKQAGWGTFGASTDGNNSAVEQRERGAQLQREAAEKKRLERAASNPASPPSPPPPATNAHLLNFGPLRTRIRLMLLALASAAELVHAVMAKEKNVYDKMELSGWKKKREQIIYRV